MHVRLTLPAVSIVKRNPASYDQWQWHACHKRCPYMLSREVYFKREREKFYIHVPSPAGLIGWNIQHIPTCLLGDNMSDIATQQVEGFMANHSIHVHVQSNASNLKCT